VLSEAWLAPLSYSTLPGVDSLLSGSRFSCSFSIDSERHAVHSNLFPPWWQQTELMSWVVRGHTIVWSYHNPLQTLYILEATSKPEMACSQWLPVILDGFRLSETILVYFSTLPRWLQLTGNCDPGWFQMKSMKVKFPLLSWHHSAPFNAQIYALSNQIRGDNRHAPSNIAYSNQINRYP